MPSCSAPARERSRHGERRRCDDHGRRRDAVGSAGRATIFTGSIAGSTGVPEWWERAAAASATTAIQRSRATPRARQRHQRRLSRAADADDHSEQSGVGDLRLAASHVCERAERTAERRYGASGSPQAGRPSRTIGSSPRPGTSPRATMCSRPAEQLTSSATRSPTPPVASP